MYDTEYLFLVPNGRTNGDTAHNCGEGTSLLPVLVKIGYYAS